VTVDTLAKAYWVSDHFEEFAVVFQEDCKTAIAKLYRLGLQLCQRKLQLFSASVARRNIK